MLKAILGEYNECGFIKVKFYLRGIPLLLQNPKVLV
jgi:hypothetical protein